MRAKLLLSQVPTPGAWSACMQQAAILQQQHKQQKQKLQETPIRMEGSPGHPKRLQISQTLKDLAKAKCSQTNYYINFSVVAYARTDSHHTSYYSTVRYGTTGKNLK